MPSGSGDDVKSESLTSLQRMGAVDSQTPPVQPQVNGSTQLPAQTTQVPSQVHSPLPQQVQQPSNANSNIPAPMSVNQNQPQFPPGVKVRGGRPMTCGANRTRGYIVAEPSWKRAATLRCPECPCTAANATNDKPPWLYLRPSRLF